MDKCDNCTIRYVCEGQHEFNCVNNNYKYYNPESKTADSGFTKTNTEICKLDLSPKEAYGTLSSKNHADTLVLNWGDSSCILIMDNFNILDLRKIPFDKLTAVELNGFRFVKEAEKNNTI